MRTLSLYGAIIAAATAAVASGRLPLSPKTVFGLACLHLLAPCPHPPPPLFSLPPALPAAIFSSSPAASESSLMTVWVSVMQRPGPEPHTLSSPPPSPVTVSFHPRCPAKSRGTWTGREMGERE